MARGKRRGEGMTQTSLFTADTPPLPQVYDFTAKMPPPFKGSDVIEGYDTARLTGQRLRIRDLMADGVYRTLREISDVTGDGESSVSAQLRHLENQHGYFKHKRRRGLETNGCWEYTVVKVPLNSEQTPVSGSRHAC